VSLHSASRRDNCSQKFKLHRDLLHGRPFSTGGSSPVQSHVRLVNDSVSEMEEHNLPEINIHLLGEKMPFSLHDDTCLTGIAFSQRKFRSSAFPADPAHCGSPAMNGAYCSDCEITIVANAGITNLAGGKFRVTDITGSSTQHHRWPPPLTTSVGFRYNAIRV
jgi:hypothetical protein